MRKITIPKLNDAFLPKNAQELKKLIISNAISLALIVVLLLVIIFARTVAWQTNVAHTGGVMFTADAWSFNAQIKMTAQNTIAAPGDSGAIDVEITNDSPQLAVASVKVLKQQLIEKMRSRMFFYVDTPTVKNGETVKVQYISSKNSYIYSVFPHQVLKLSAADAQQPVIKWEWTYDNLGYYVYGQKTDSGVQVEEYLMPIKYDFDYMRTTFDSNGKLKTIDGTLTKEAFLKEFSKTDGYVGTIDTGAVTSDGFYPVEVDEQTGVGVFAYFSTLEEINEGSENDAELGSASESLGQAVIQFVGQNGGGNGALVLDQSTLDTALANPGLNVLKLEKDINLTKSVSLKSGSQTIIDLNGHKITSAANKVFDVADGASLILNNGSIVGSGESAISCVSACVTLNSVSLSNTVEGIIVHDHKSTLGADSIIHLNDCDINAIEDGLLIYGNNSSDKKTKIIIENSSVIGREYTGIICNGANFGTDISIENSTLKGKYAAIYFPQRESDLNIKSSKLEGYTGIAIKGGNVNILDSTIIGTGAHTALPDDPSKLPNSGWVDTGDGVYVESNYTTWQTNVTISGEKTKIIGTESGTLAVRKYPIDAQSASVEITGGVFNTDVSAFVKEGYKVNKVSDGYEVVKN